MSITSTPATATETGTLVEPNLTAALPVLCVDLDGTLIRTDMLWECLVSALKRNPLILFLVPFWLIAGRAHLKAQLAQKAKLDVASLPYREEVLEFLRERRAAGCTLVLASAAAQDVVNQVSEFLGIFDCCFGSSSTLNLKGRAKADFLVKKFSGGFEYLGDSRADLPVWSASSAAHVVGSQGLALRVRRRCAAGLVFPTGTGIVKTWIAALRGLHWLKNLLVFLPLALAHKLDPRSWILTALGFVCFGACASGVYVLNDLLDLHSDRIHPWKYKRPLAAGEISIRAGLLISALLLLTAIPGSFLLERKFGLVMTGYTLLTVWYSAYLKKIALLDVFVLSSFYSIRIWAGALLTGVTLSQWFLSFALFFFLSLSISKRYSELVHANDLIAQGRSGRGYIASDRPLLMVLGVASGFSAVIVFSLYLHSPEVLVLYRHVSLLMLLAPTLAYWLSRLWLEANRGNLRDDPVLLALRDPLSYAIAALALLVLIVSSVKPL